MTDAEIIDAISVASDRQESRTWNGNMLATEEFSSVSVGKKVVYTLAASGGVAGFVVSDI